MLERWVLLTNILSNGVDNTKRGGKEAWSDADVGQAVYSRGLVEGADGALARVWDKDVDRMLGSTKTARLPTAKTGGMCPSCWR